MPFQYSCFISYRHPMFQKDRSYVQQLVEALKGELALWVSQPVFLDTERLKGGEFYNPALASALCHSVCMIALYSPPYFHEDHIFCSREFRAMEKLEQERLQLLQDAVEKKNGLIIFIALRGHDHLTSKIPQDRMCYDFEPYTLRSGIRWTDEAEAKIREIGTYIFGRCQVFENLARQHNLCGDCNNFTLPNEDETKQWLGRLTSRGVLPLPSREADPNEHP